MSDGPIAAFRDTPRWFKVVLIILALGAVPASRFYIMIGLPILALMVTTIGDHPFVTPNSVVGDSLTDTEARLGPARKLRRDTGHGRQEWEYSIDLGWAGGLGPDGKYLLLKVSPAEIIEEAEIVYE